MWNGISVPSGKKRLETLSSTYYAFIAKKGGTAILPVIPERTIELTPTDEIDGDEETPSAVPVPTSVLDESFVRQNRHMRTRPPHVVRPRNGINSTPSPSANVNTNVISEPLVNRGSPPVAQTPNGPTRFQIRRQILTSSEQLHQVNEVSNGIQFNHTFPRRQLPYSPPSVTNLIDHEPTISIVDRVQNPTRSATHVRPFADTPKPLRRSDYQDLSVTRKPLDTPVKKREVDPMPVEILSEQSCSSGSRSVFDVEEDSKFEFYVEDQQSGEVTNLESEPASPDTTDAPENRPQQPTEILKTPVQSNEITCSQALDDKDSTPALVSPQSSLIVYSNPRFGSRYACKEDGAITSAIKRAYLTPNTSRKSLKSTEIPAYSRPVRAFSTSEKLKRDILEMRYAVKPVRRTHSEYTPEDGDVFEEVVPVNQGQQEQPTDQEYKDSTLFIFPPVLSESNVSVCLKRKSHTNDEPEDDELPDPDLKAIRKYNVECALADANLSIPSSEGSGSKREDGSMYSISGTCTCSSMVGSRYKVSSRSSTSLVTNIPCDAWMMFPLRVLPAEMVPWGLLIYVPIIVLMILLIGYCLVTWLPFAM